MEIIRAQDRDHKVYDIKLERIDKRTVALRLDGKMVADFQVIRNKAGNTTLFMYGGIYEEPVNVDDGDVIWEVSD